jgi:DNA-binding NarL/FixJ family response regulator
VTSVLFPEVAVRVVLAEDNAFLREGLRSLLNGTGQVDVIAVCGTLDELLAAVDADPPDVVLTDIRMPPSHTDEGVQAAQRLRRSHPKVGVLALSQYLEPELATTLLREGSGGRGYALKERADDVAYVVGALASVAAGGSFVDDQVIDALVRGSMSRTDSPLDVLTARERAILREVARGKNNAAVGDELGISEHAVQKHINSIFSKLGLVEDGETHRRVAAVLLYLSDEGGAAAC